MRVPLTAKLLFVLTGPLLLLGCPTPTCACLPPLPVYGTVSGMVLDSDSAAVGGSTVRAEYRTPGCDGPELELLDPATTTTAAGTYELWLESFERADSLPCYRVRAELAEGDRLRTSDWTEFTDQVPDPQGFEVAVDLVLGD